jgi:hypothetical protein
MTLSYTTTDSGFAERARDALEAAGVPVHVTPTTTNIVSYVGTPPQYTVRILRQSDEAKANAILLKLGAARQKPFRLPTGKTGKLLALTAALIITILLGLANLA